jgi:hypothetical protein
VLWRRKPSTLVSQNKRFEATDQALWIFKPNGLNSQKNRLEYCKTSLRYFGKPAAGSGEQVRHGSEEA